MGSGIRRGQRALKRHNPYPKTSVTRGTLTSANTPLTKTQSHDHVTVVKPCLTTGETGKRMVLGQKHAELKSFYQREGENGFG